MIVPFGLCVWSTGLAPNPLIQSITEFKKHGKTGSYACPLPSLPSSTENSGFPSLITDKHLRVLDPEGQHRPNIWAIGDAAIIDGQPLPATAQVASQKAMV